ncbi:CsbD family protein [Luteitalea sp.]|uniref:CsbD family protein n=1 Tax=Luteitalea sp. TaxID=2004800 RepID=UPI0025B83AF9|nr:CsbD family protein [Luteitalea sp.]
MNLPSVDELKGKWREQMGAAKVAWGELTDDELLKVEGHEDKLAGLIEQRYAISREEAEKQVKHFFDSHRG